MLYVITGPPAAGKTTWVRERAKPGDVVIDYDAIAAALTIRAPSHGHARIIRDIAYRARAAAIQEALKHTTDVDVYLIHTLPPADALAKYEEHNAQIVTVDPGRDVVMQRITEQRTRSMVAVAERWYAAARHATQPAQRRSRHW
ncbi:AAA family ATPase [Thermoactinospora rubra]|uniref:AAA family ATPase n=1 Tax=Thermoactinospora rubra TaxID=1088767 RepID=UPI000A10F100|nr:AAA family ATPase [Thermoactinospora rubra]